MDIRDLISRKFDTIAKIAFAITTESDSLALKLLAPPITKAFEKMEVYGGKPNLTIEENLARFKVKNSEYDIASQVDYFVRQQIEKPDKQISYGEYSGSIFATDPQTKQLYTVSDIYVPTLIKNPQIQALLGILLRFGIAKEGISGLEEKIKILKSGFIRFTDEDVELSKQLIYGAADPKFVEEFQKQYFANIATLHREVIPTHDGKFELIYSTAGSWSRDPGTYINEYDPGYPVKHVNI